MPTPPRAGAEPRPLHLAGGVLVVGGGPAGLAAAIGLRMATGLDVVVAEPRDVPTERFGETLAPGTLAGLDRLGLSDTFRGDGHLPCPGGVSVWGSSRHGYNDFILDPVGPAWHIDRPRFEAMLRTRAAQVGATVWTRARAVAAARCQGGFDVVVREAFASVTHLRPAWVIDASGAGAWFARRQGARSQRYDQLLAIVRFADLAEGTFTAQTVLESVPAGWWYVARLPAGRIVTVLVTDPDGARSFPPGAFDRWRRELAATHLVGPRLTRCTLRNERFRLRAVPVAVLDRIDGDGWLAVGDAAGARDPIGGRGIHDALADAADATRTIAAMEGAEESAPSTYADRVRARFADHLLTRADLYGRERRWPSAPFWARRHQSLGSSL